MTEPRWQEDVPCLGKTDLFFGSDVTFDPGPALALCAVCPHTEECRALRKRTDGVWGGVYYPSKGSGHKYQRKTDRPYERRTA